MYFGGKEFNHSVEITDWRYALEVMNKYMGFKPTQQNELNYILTLGFCLLAYFFGIQTIFYIYVV